MKQNTNLTVAKICHELTNYLSVLNFIREDIINGEEINKKELVRTIELLTSTMDFFRNVYSNNINYKSMKLVLQQIFSLKNIIISCDDDKVFFDVSEKVKCVVCGLLYIIMKSSKTGDKINISRTKDDIVIQLPSTLPNSVSSVFAEKKVDEDIFNVFANYLKEDADQNGYGIKATNNEIIVWKK